MSASIDALPNELLLFIFKHLSIQNLVNCRSVCKRFLCLCHEVKIAELQISNIIENVKYYSFHTHKQYNHKDAINVPTFTTYRTMFRLDKFLRRFHFKGYIYDFHQLNLNDLTQLEELKICLEGPISLSLREIHLSLPNLKVLEIYDGNKFVFHLTTPKLKILKCCDFERIHMADFSTIDRLEFDYYSGNIHFNVMANVQILQIETAASHLIDSNLHILSVFPKLKMLVCRDIHNSHSLFELKLNKPELKIYLESVELIDKRKCDEYMSEECNLAFQIKNYDLLCDKISHCCPLFYNELMELVGVEGTLPNDFYNKYANYEEVIVSDKVENQSHFLRFLKHFDYISTLEFHDTVLDQSLYDGLHEIGQITSLTLENCPIVNYDFLLKLKLLNEFFTHNDSDLFDMSFQLFRRLKYFKRIFFKCNGKSFSMDMTDRRLSAFRFCINKNPMNFESLGQIVNWYDLKFKNTVPLMPLTE